MNQVIIDTDPGIDDAIAILMALAELDVLGLTTVFGNCAVDVANASRDLQQRQRVAGRRGGRGRSGQPPSGLSGYARVAVPPKTSSRSEVDSADVYDRAASWTCA